MVSSRFTVPNAPITIGIIVTCMFHSFFNSLARSRYLSFLSYSYIFILWSAKSTILQVLFFLLINFRSGLLTEIRWSMYISKSHRSLCVLFSRTGAGLCIYQLFIGSNLNFLHISQWITLPTQSCLVLYSFCANMLHSLIMWLMVSSLSPHNLHLLFCCVLSILALKWLVLSVLFCAAIELFSFPFFVSKLLSFCSPSCYQYRFWWLKWVFLHIVFESLYRCINSVFNAGKSSSSLFSLHGHKFFLFFVPFV